MAAQERDLLKRAYPNKKWANKVDKMTNSEVSAILIRLQAQGRLRKG